MMAGHPQDRLRVKGIPGTYGNLDDMKNCQSKEMKFLNCHLIQNNLPANGDYKGTTVIIDDGLSLNTWRKLEENFVDIVRYVTRDPITGEVKEFGSKGKDCKNLFSFVRGRFVRCSLLSKTAYLSSSDDTHGGMVTSAFGTIARGAEVIFIDLNLGDSLGFSFNIQLLEWLNNAVVPYNIKVASMSWSGPNPSENQTQVEALLDSLYLNGVFLVSAIGNDGKNEGGAFPQNHRFVYAVGSVDHENRGLPWDGDYYSSYGKFTGDVAYYRFHSCKDGLVTFCSSYGSSSFGDEATDFVMPGNGVLTAQFDAAIYVAKYSMGTSFSTPFLAAAALIAQYAFYLSNEQVYGSGAYLTPADLYEVLKTSSSRTSWDPYFGWGYIDLNFLYDYTRSLAGE